MTPTEALALLDLPESERKVEYRPAHDSYHGCEQGLLTGAGDRFGFVRYWRHGILQQTAAATRLTDLHLV